MLKLNEKRGTLAGMTRSPYLTISASQEIKDAIKAHCAKNGEEVSDWIRTTLCEAIGKPKLAKRMRTRGRPEKAKELQ